jgi:hypothetical protein
MVSITVTDSHHLFANEITVDFSTGAGTYLTDGWRVFAEHEGQLRMVEGAEGWGGPDKARFLDPAVPLGVPVIYHLMTSQWPQFGFPYDVRKASSAKVTRQGPGKDYGVFTSYDGRLTVIFRWMHNLDPKEKLPQYTMFNIAGRKRPALRLDTTAWAGDGEIKARMDQLNTNLMNDLIDQNEEVILRTGGPDVVDLPSVERIFLHTVPNKLAAKYTPSSRREWEFVYTLVDFDPLSSPQVPIVTVGEVADLGMTVGQVTTTGLTIAQVAAGGLMDA